MSKTYVVQPGDTLTRIAHEFDTTVEALVEANAFEEQGRDPDLIYAGEVLTLPEYEEEVEICDEDERPQLARGSRGTEVEELQELLNALGYVPGPIDGVFGENTEEAVMIFQQDTGLDADGIVGPRTWAALDTAAEEL
jgi:N-acetylmuramoyl-L-alanine amidase